MVGFVRRRRAYLWAAFFGIMSGFIFLACYTITSRHVWYELRPQAAMVSPPALPPAEPSNKRRETPSSSTSSASSICTIHQALTGLELRLSLNDSHLDRRKLYRIHENVILAKKSIAQEHNVVCLSSIASLSHLHWLPELAEHWTGPASVSVFVHGHALEFVIVYISFLRSCFPTIRDNFTFHLVFPADHNESLTIVNDDLPRILQHDSDVPLFCSSYKDLSSYFTGLLKKFGDTRTMFPQNHLRNVAREGCSASQFYYMIDVDAMPQYGLYERLLEFLPRRQPCDKCLYVVPAFEGNVQVSHPRTKKELLARYGKKKHFRVYHVIAFWKNQGATNITRWMSLPDEEELKPAYEANFKFGYECFYVGPHTVPKYRERFIGYGFTRNVQTLESYLAGYKFLVLNNAFMIHRGLRNRTRNEPFREKEKTHNYKTFLAFRGTLQKTYGRGKEFT
ncbi:beta-1,4-glucuronyltransferase 1-like isoform X2 [Ornithodoros turicata]